MCVASFAIWGASSLANYEMKVPLSDKHIPSLTSFRAATNNLSFSDWCITLVSWNLRVMACWTTLDKKMKRRESKQLGTGRSWRNSPTIIICFPANGNFSWHSSTEKWWCKAFTCSIILALDMLASSQIKMSILLNFKLTLLLVAARKSTWRQVCGTKSIKRMHCCSDPVFINLACENNSYKTTLFTVFANCVDYLRLANSCLTRN